jgi:malonate-semialdehyde dehydrogenase (acetylating)/methylmalonate-semialdehyde dehydrogenase
MSCSPSPMRASGPIPGSSSVPGSLPPDGEVSRAERGRVVAHLIGGREVPPRPEGRRSTITNPATGQVSGSVELATPEIVGSAVDAARAAFSAWRDTSLSRRSTILFSFRELLDAHREELAALITAEHGKTLEDAGGEVARGIEVAEFACGITELLKGQYSENVSSRVDTFSIRQPLGVVAGITPFNFPVMVPMWMFPIAIACGNTFVLKPSEKDPSASLLLGSLLAQAGLPDGVFNVVHGDKEAVGALLSHRDVAAISFVGSTPVARYVYTAGTATGKRVQALGGAKNHMLVLPDADLGLAADAAVSAGFGSAGERCMAISVVVVLESIADALLEAIVDRMGRVGVGPGTDPGVEMGPLVTAEHRDRVASYLDRGEAEGARLVVDGRTHDLVGSRGFFLGPSLLDRVTPAMSVYTDEIFGPVLCVVRVADFDEGVALINASPYGNGTAIFTNDGGAARAFQHEVEVGMVGLNVPIPVPVASYSFGGWKSSLFGDSHVYGDDGVHFYTRGKVVTSRWLDPSHAGLSLGFPAERRKDH